MNKKIVLVLLTAMFFAATPALAAKKRVAPRALSRGTGTVSTTSGVKSYVRLQSNHLALLIDFSGFDNIKSGSYELTYTASGIGQGAGGSILLGDSSTKTLLFGTCSKGVCTYHTNITNARLTITSNLNNGLKVIKTYRIKV